MMDDSAQTVTVIDLTGEHDISHTLAAGHWALMGAPGTGARVAEIITRDPAGRYPADLIRRCDASTRPGDTWDGAAFVPAHAPPPAAPSRVISSVAFLGLWTPAETAATEAADPVLLYGCRRALAQGTVNLDSPELAALLDLAVAKGGLTRASADRIKAGQPPA